MVITMCSCNLRRYSLKMVELGEVLEDVCLIYIYIQGNRVERNFDIHREAGGESFRPVQRNYTAPVTANYLEIHLFLAGKGASCCIPNQGTYGPSISAISVTPLFQPRRTSSATDNNTTAIVVGVVIPVIVIAVLSLVAFWFIQRRKRLHAAEDELTIPPDPCGYPNLPA